jgi:hypothetical protein
MTRLPQLKHSIQYSRRTCWNQMIRGQALTVDVNHTLVGI